MPLPKSVGLPNAYQQSEQQLQRRQQIADMLAQQSLAQEDTQFVGPGSNPVAVRKSPYAQIAKLGQAYYSNRISNDVEQKRSEIAKQITARRDSYLAEHPEMSGPQQGLDAGVDPAIVAASMRPSGNEPNSVREYEFAKKSGFTGSFQDWITTGGQSSRPSSVQEWEFYNAMLEEDKKNGTNRAAQYLEMKRNPNIFVKDVNQVPTVIRPSVGGTATTALSSLPTEATAAGAIKQSEAAGGALGKAQGEIAGGIQTRGANAVGTGNLIEIAEPLIDVATGSTAGAAADSVAKFFGKATSGAEAIAQLKVLQAGLMTSMPRMEGPQSDADVRLYREAAGQIGDPTVPAPLKKAAVQTIKQIQQKYIERAQGAGTNPTAAASPTGPVQIKSDDDFARLPSGTEFIAPDGSHRRKP